MAHSSDLDRDLKQLEVDLRKLEGEYNMFFAGRLPRPPWESRSRVEKLVRRIDNTHISNYGERFRFTTLQTRFMRFVELWDRALRAREEGRPSPFGQRSAPGRPGAAAPRNRVVQDTAFRDPLKEMDKLRDLYERLVDARREVGEDSVPFRKFTDLVKGQVSRLRQSGADEVAFRVMVKDGKVNFTARPVKEPKDGGT